MSLTITSVAFEGPGWDACRAIRQVVFVEEQACPPEEEWDAWDATAMHYLATADGVPVATARWRVVPYDGERMAKLERFAVLEDARGRGYGRRLVQHLIAEAAGAGFAVQMLHAQAHLEDFYRGFGFRPVGEEFMEAGIPHVMMVRKG